MSAPKTSEQTRTKNEFMATRLARIRRISGVAPRVKARKTSADPGGLTIGKIAASTSRKVLNASLMPVRSGPSAYASLAGKNERPIGVAALGLGHGDADRSDVRTQQIGPVARALLPELERIGEG